MGDQTNLPNTLLKAVKYFSGQTTCREFLAALRWENGPICPKCGSDCVTLLETRNIYKCRTCKKQFSIKVGTIFEDSPIGLDKWLPAAWLIINCKNGVSSYEIARDLGVTQKTAWFMLHRIRLAMQCGTFEKLSGIVEADETYIGGKAANMHAFKLAQLKARGLVRAGTEGKTIVAGLLKRNSESTRASRARVKVMPNVRGFHIRRNVIDNVEKGASVFTDSLRSYRNLPLDGFVHEFVDHTERYVRDNVHTNGMENFWSLFKRALKGTYVSVEPFHLQAYADEQCFRFNERDLNDLERFVLVMSQVIGRRITYKQLTGKDVVEEPADEPME
jgi:transposase-like protein